ncbi:MAG: hypothetical protein KDI51_00550 [Xanthomonadales bacterium]|nr:hypothetical protein [Xanthomonadales bacterium]
MDAMKCCLVFFVLSVSISDFALAQSSEGDGDDGRDTPTWILNLLEGESIESQPNDQDQKQQESGVPKASQHKNS